MEVERRRPVPSRTTAKHNNQHVT
ncbi:TPA: hypothetical protein N0F65_004346 [Lagenidium giganteum]|uniref:Uncharacterized protein n=1 Tax=Lagenidium giganteum TaxID=4803 RepID=A0AAV2YL05_9STRA|nr:TPA: hypothetical protein N0F65_004346 [Lagenidium giganteum]